MADKYADTNATKTATRKILENIQEFGNHPTLDVVSLFAHHLQLLGTSRAHWPTRPIR
jgi:hypothetical protein